MWGFFTRVNSLNLYKRGSEWGCLPYYCLLNFLIPELKRKLGSKLELGAWAQLQSACLTCRELWFDPEHCIKLAFEAHHACLGTWEEEAGKREVLDYRRLFAEFLFILGYM